MPLPARLALALLIAIATGPAAKAQGCCLAVRPAPPAPTLRLDLAGPGGTTPAPAADPFIATRALPATLPFMPAPGLRPPTQAMSLTLTTGSAQGGAQVSLSLGLREVAPADAGPYAPRMAR